MDRGQTVSTEKKLQLVKLLRTEDAHNRMKMRSREELLYGRNSYGYRTEIPSWPTEEGSEETEPVFSSLKLRFLAAFILLAVFVAWDNGYVPVPGLRTEQVYEALSGENNMTNLFAFMENFPYTLESE